MSKYTCSNCNEPCGPMGHDCTTKGIINITCDAAARVVAPPNGQLILYCQGLKRGHTTPHRAYLRSAAGTTIESFWR